LLLTKLAYMKKNIIGALVGGLLFFICQTLSWTVLNLHQPAQDYTPAQDTIMSVLNSTITKEGGYLLPSAPSTASSDEMMKKAEANLGKPWASIQYHKSYNNDMKKMTMNMVKGLLFSMLMIFLVCWITGKFAKPTFVNVFSSTLFIGLAVYINIPYSSALWYDIFDAKAYLVEILMCWGVTGLWLGWWMGRNK